MPLRKIHHPVGAYTAEEKKEFAEMNLTDHAGVRLTHGKPKVNGVEIHYAIGGGFWLAAIGDVCGKGAEAAARAGQVRDMLRVLIRDGRPLTRALELLNDLMIETGDDRQYCTLAVAYIRKITIGEPPGLTVDLVLAGHEPPLLIRANGTAEFVGQSGTPLGILNQVTLYATRLHLAPGDTLLAFTDGVTERRGPEGLYGPHRLITAASATYPLSPAQLIATVRTSVQNFANQQPKDDIALLAIRATTPT